MRSFDLPGICEKFDQTRFKTLATAVESGRDFIENEGLIERAQALGCRPRQASAVDLGDTPIDEENVIKHGLSLGSKAAFCASNKKPVRSMNSPEMKMLTDGMGFIGSHTAVLLLEAGHDVVLYDNLSNSDAGVVDRIEKITGRRPLFIEGDIRDKTALEKALKETQTDAVIHFAGLKAVGESVSKPLEYYDNNIVGTLRLLQAMKNTGVSRLIFSSSSTVYGTPEKLPLTEDCPTGEATNPYGRTKLHIEQILADCCVADPALSVVCLRYFNPIGAHPSGLIGEDPNGIPNNLLLYVARVASGRLECLHVFGNDYDTPDGTGVRDFIHVMDLADGHAKALPYVMSHTGWIAVNLGCGRGYSVLEVVKAFEKASGKKIPYKIDPRRPGDIVANWCDPARAAELFGGTHNTALMKCAGTAGTLKVFARKNRPRIPDSLQPSPVFGRFRTFFHSNRPCRPT